MQTAIIYASVHHKNTEKLVTEIAAQIPDVTTIDATKAIMIDLSKYDYVGIASGIYMGKFHKSLFTFLSENLPEHKKVFLMYTCGSDNKKYTEEMKDFLASKTAMLINVFSCKGYDTFGPFKLVGGLNKNHPDKNDIETAVQFVKNIVG